MRRLLARVLEVLVGVARMVEEASRPAERPVWPRRPER
jgi:hypothetical protein